MRARDAVRDDRPMLTEFSNQLADAAAAAAPSVVQVQGRRRAASGIVYGQGTVVTTVQGGGRVDGLRVGGRGGGGGEPGSRAGGPGMEPRVVEGPALGSP